MKPLLADALRDDPRIAQAKELLESTLGEYRQQLDRIRPPVPERVASYQSLLDRLAKARGGAPYFPYLGSGLGNGPFVELADGSVKLDFIVGIGVHGMGHSHSAMLASSIDAAIENTIMQGTSSKILPPWSWPSDWWLWRTSRGIDGPLSAQYQRRDGQRERIEDCLSCTVSPPTAYCASTIVSLVDR